MKFLSVVFGFMCLIFFFDLFCAAIELTIKFYLAFFVVSVALKLIAGIFML